MLRNRAHLEGRIVVGPHVSGAMEALAYDPQTSGGLPAALAPDAPVPAGFTVVGDVAPGPPYVHLTQLA